jgi:hypothetical protein
VKKLIILLLCSSYSFAIPCWYIEESDPVLANTFESKEYYYSAIYEWSKQRPALPNPILLAKAYSVYSSEKSLAESLGRDKRSHCYIGCRVAQETDFRTTNFMAWLKEDQDLKDCNRDTHFEVKDYNATIDGGLYGIKTNDPLLCQQYCTQNW